MSHTSIVAYKHIKDTIQHGNTYRIDIYKKVE